MGTKCQKLDNFLSKWINTKAITVDLDCVTHKRQLRGQTYKWRDARHNDSSDCKSSMIEFKCVYHLAKHKKPYRRVVMMQENSDSKAMELQNLSYLSTYLKVLTRIYKQIQKTQIVTKLLPKSQCSEYR